MLEPEYLDGLPEPVLELYRQVEITILQSMAERISRLDYWIPAADWQNLKLKEAGVFQDEILKVLAEMTGRAETELRDLMERATSEALRADVAVYAAAGEVVPPIADSAELIATLNAGYFATRQTMRNLTRTIANTATKQFEDALDIAWLQVRSGAFSYDHAVRHAVKKLAGDGIGAITYPSGHIDTIEVAVRRAVVTGVNQTAGQLSDRLADVMGSDLVEVSAHAGARPTHAEWQGKIYSRSGKSKKYPDFKKKTGYGTGDGLCGWNCRHSFAPWIEGMPRAYSDRQLRSFNEKTVTYNGKQYTEYEASQIQRRLERNVRKWKRENAAMGAAGQSTEESAAKIKEYQAKLRGFTAETGLKRQYAREQVPK